MPAADEPVLELEGPGGSLDPGTQPVVGRGQEGELEPDLAGETRGHCRQRLTRLERSCADKVEADVSVAELEPGLLAELLRSSERVPGLVCAPPAALLVGESRQRVEQRVEVRRDVQAEDLDVVADVPDDRQLAGHLDETACEAGAPDAAGE